MCMLLSSTNCIVTPREPSYARPCDQAQWQSGSVGHGSAQEVRLGPWCWTIYRQVEQLARTNLIQPKHQRQAGGHEAGGSIYRSDDAIDVAEDRLRREALVL